MQADIQNKQKHLEESNLSLVMEQMSSTLEALEKAFERAMDLSDPMDQINYEICRTTKKNAPKREPQHEHLNI